MRAIEIIMALLFCVCTASGGVDIIITTDADLNDNGGKDEFVPLPDDGVSRTVYIWGASTTAAEAILEFNFDLDGSGSGLSFESVTPGPVFNAGLSETDLADLQFGWSAFLDPVQELSVLPTYTLFAAIDIAVAPGTAAGTPATLSLAGSDATMKNAANSDIRTAGTSRDLISVPPQCRSDRECDDRTPCTTDTCMASMCVFTPIEGCCVGDQDCDDGDVCTVDTCIGNTCEIMEVAGCCTSDITCDDDDPCTTDVCMENHCQNTTIDGCCSRDSQCDDGDACTTDSCESGSCTFVSIPQCCGSASQCDDRDPCTSDECVASQCQHDAIAGCCTADVECEDGSPCTMDTCLNNTCEQVELENCCLGDPECDDGDVCTSDTCIANNCKHARKPGCCNAANPCDDDDPCTMDECVAGACLHTAVTGCCQIDDECDDGDICTVDMCLANECWNNPLPQCCRQDVECEDQDPCSIDVCVRNNCEYMDVAGCCILAAECDDGLYCNGAELCRNNSCMDGGAPCGPDELCDEVNDRCTTCSDCEREGCGPGFWKQRHHYCHWILYHPLPPNAETFEDVFNVDTFGQKTLLDVLRQGGGKQNALGRQAVAAILNVQAVDYGLTAEEVIGVVQRAFASGELLETLELLEELNLQQCSLRQCR